MVSTFSSQSVPLAFSTFVFQCISIFELAFTLSIIAALALSFSDLTSKCTLLPYFVRYAASSHAESPPPITANSSSLNCGVAPSQIAQALIPLLQNLSSFITPNLLALAPVAIIIELDLMLPSKVFNSKGLLLVSIEITSLSYKFVPHLSA